MADDPPLTPEELRQLKELRKGKPPSRAAPFTSYRDPAEAVKYENEQIELLKRKVGPKWK